MEEDFYITQRWFSFCLYSFHDIKNDLWEAKGLDYARFVAKGLDYARFVAKGLKGRGCYLVTFSKLKISA